MKAIRALLYSSTILAVFGSAYAQQMPRNQGGTTTDIGVPVVGSSGNVAAATATATLAASSTGKTTYICGFMISGLGATAGAAVLGTVTNLGGTYSFNVGVPAGTTVPITAQVVNFSACLPANAPNTAIAVSVPSFGSGNTAASAVAWGFQLP